MMNEYEVLDILWESLSEDGSVGASIYEKRGDMTRPEMYLTVNGECWRIMAEPHHTHGLD